MLRIENVQHSIIYAAQHPGILDLLLIQMSRAEWDYDTPEYELLERIASRVIGYNNDAIPYGPRLENGMYLSQV